MLVLTIIQVLVGLTASFMGALNYYASWQAYKKGKGKLIEIGYESTSVLWFILAALLLH